MAIPATVFAVLLVIVVAISLNKVPVEEKWVILRAYEAWRPYRDAGGNAIAADGRFCFVRPIDAARGPAPARTHSPRASGKPSLA